MAEKDITEKLLEDYNDVFADIVNVLLFDGKRVVSPEKLQETGVKSQYKAGAKIHELERDVAKLWQEGNVQIALCGLENQTKSERDMPLRVIGYDGNSYRAQLLNSEKWQRYPVLTLVLYFGMERWNQPKNLKKLLNIPKELDEYINFLVNGIYQTLSNLCYAGLIDMYQSISVIRTCVCNCSMGRTTACTMRVLTGKGRK